MRILAGSLAVALWTAASGNLTPLLALASDIVSLDDISHIHAIAVDRTGTQRLYLATHNGLLLGTPSGAPLHVSKESDDLMGFVAHPTDSQVFYASGHPARGGNLGLMRSNDSGRTWSQWAKGAEGPVDFHTMDVSKADPKVIYGFYKGIQISR